MSQGARPLIPTRRDLNFIAGVSIRRRTRGTSRARILMSVIQTLLDAMSKSPRPSRERVRVIPMSDSVETLDLSENRDNLAVLFLEPPLDSNL